MARPLSLAALGVALALTTSGSGARAAGHDLAARVNGAGITRERLDRYFEERLQSQGRPVAGIRSPEAFKALKKEALDALVDRELLWQEARRRKHVAPRKEVEAAMTRFREEIPDPARRRLDLEQAGFTEESYAEYVRQELSIRRLVDRDVVPRVKVSDADVHAFYEENPRHFGEPAEVRARHVLVKSSASEDPGRREEARRRIEAVLAEARGGADFAELARRHSEDATAADGGDLGWFPRGRMVPAFEEAAFALEGGGISEVVETPFGFHVIRVEERRPESRLPEAEAADAIRAHLRAMRTGEAVAARIAELRGRARIEILVPL